MSGICIVSGTNRKESKTFQVAQIYQQVLIDQNISQQLFSLTDLPRDIAFSALSGESNDALQELIVKYIDSCSKFVFISPEYNGSFPGVLKTFLDAVHPKHWANKKAALVGVADGRAGNLRGMEHLTNILNHLKVNVYYNKIPVSQVNNILSEPTGKSMQELVFLFKRQVSGFLEF